MFVKVFKYLYLINILSMENKEENAKIYILKSKQSIDTYINRNEFRKAFGLLILVFARISPLPFYRKILFTQSIAFATSSSKATLSTAINQLQEKMGVSKVNSNFLMPLGVCVNMDGTAIYLGICALFFSQAYGMDLTTGNYLMLVLTCTLGSIGAAGIPSGSIIFMGMVLNSVGLPIEGIGIILGVDRILDMIRTTINITGDTAITLIIDKSEGMLDEKVYNSKS